MRQTAATFQEGGVRPKCVAVRADDIALFNLGNQLLARFEEDMTTGDREEFLAWVAMIEIHHVRRKHLSAVVTRDSSKIS